MKLSVSIISLFFLVSASNSIAQVPSVIRVEIDWMADATHSHRPTVAEMEAVRQMFACHGINFIYIIDDSLQHFNTIRRDPANVNNVFGYNNGMDTYGGIKAARFDNNGGGWHYCIFGHQYQDTSYNPSGSSGLGETPGDDFIVTLGAFSPNTGTPWDRVGTFAHELGHNLGLDHAGDMAPGIVGANTPTVPSIMTYFFQLAGVKTNLKCQGLIDSTAHLFKDLDYSNGIGCTVDENALNENFGLGMKRVDWSCDTTTGIVPHDISNQSTWRGWCGAAGGLQVLSDFNEWANIRDVTLSSEPYVSREVSCITAQEHESYKGLMGGCPQPAVVNEQCITARMIYVQNGAGSGSGRCTSPYGTLLEAHTLSNDGDVWFIAPGNHTGAGLVLTKRITLAGPGGAVIGQ